MSKPTGNKSAAPRKGGGSMLMGILVGMVVGVALAAGLAWFIMRSPSPFVNKESARPVVETVEKAVVDVAKPAVEAVQPRVEAVSEGSDSKPRFEFYKVLTDKQPAEGVPKATESAPKAMDKSKVDKAADKPVEKKIEKPVEKASDSKAAPARANYLQAGSFANSSDAENMKASLAMKGMEASVQDVSIPGKGVWHRVRVGPFSSEKDMNSALGTLKLNGMDATPTH